jgi:serine-type D-Ala-D-Ala carboxypeptidase (penicillin-binding protein 5/6)
MRLSARMLIAGLAVVAMGLAAGCSAAPGAAYAKGVTAPSAVRLLSPSAVRSTGSPAATAGPAARVLPAGPQLTVVGAPSGVKAKAGVLADAVTGQVLWAKQATTERPIASITKVMTALLVIQAGTLDRKIKIQKASQEYVAKWGGEAAGLVPGQVLTTDQLLHALLIVSAADAAYTLASAYGPGLPAFVARMNAEAASLGLTHTHFTSPDGLPYPTETATYSTPVELLKLGELAMNYPEFSSIVRLKFFQLKKAPGHGAYWWDTTNELIGYYHGAVGIKTGYTDVAGHTLLFEAIRGGRTLIGVVLGSPPTGPGAGAQDAARLLNWGFTLKQSS